MGTEFEVVSTLSFISMYRDKNMDNIQKRGLETVNSIKKFMSSFTIGQSPEENLNILGVTLGSICVFVLMLNMSRVEEDGPTDFVNSIFLSSLSAWLPSNISFLLVVFLRCLSVVLM